MQKLAKTLAFLMLIVGVVVAAGCKKPDDPTDPNNPNNGGGGNNEGGGGGNPTPTVPTEEGMYLGIIGFNEQLYQKDISLLNTATKSQFTSFISGLTQADFTALYYADYTALQKLKDYPEPPTLTQVALVTFTDGIDNISISNSIMDPNGYGSKANYRAALNTMIMGEQVHGKNISAYSIGFRGPDALSNLNEFQTNINMLASSPNNVFEVTNMNEALERFEYIANTLYTQNTTVNVKVKLPGGIDDGLTIRFTFDNVASSSDVDNSSKYIQATYRRTGNNGRQLENVTYHGFVQGANTMPSIDQSELGTYHWFEFENLAKPGTPNSTPVSQNEIDNLQLWKKQGASWQKESEFTPNSSSLIEEKRSSALIMLVLDCTSSLDDEFLPMKNAATRFVETLVTSSGGGNGGGGNGGSNEPPDGIVNGQFSVSPSQKVYFSKGNLQYQASTSTWRFASHQYDYIGSENANISPSNSGWIDLFGWGTSNFAHGANNYQPYSTSQNYNDYMAYSAATANLYDQTGLADWGMNAISNGGNETRVWRTLTKDEWNYLLQSRNTASGLRYAKAEVAGKNGLVVLPDNWNASTYTLSNTNSNNASFSDNVISSSNWGTMEAAGAVFLPAAGSRAGTSVSGTGANGYYWSSSCQNQTYAYLLSFNDANLAPTQGDFRYYGQSVRSVCNAE